LAEINISIFEKKFFVKLARQVPGNH